jgi:hypothetical protein
MINSCVNFIVVYAVILTSYVDILWCTTKVFTRWFKYDREDLCVNKSQFVPVIFEPPCILTILYTIWRLSFKMKLAVTH